MDWQQCQNYFYSDLPSTSPLVPHSEYLPFSFAIRTGNFPTASIANFYQHWCEWFSWRSNLPKSKEVKGKAFLLASQLKQWNLVEEDVKVSKQRNRPEAFSFFFTNDDGRCFSNEVKHLFEKIGNACLSFDGGFSLTAYREQLAKDMTFWDGWFSDEKEK